LTFPFRYKVTGNIDDLNEVYTSLTPSTPSVLLLDNTYTPLNIIDYGQGFNYPLWAFHASMFTTIAGIQVASPALLDDATANDNPANAAWISFTAGTMVGSLPAAGVDLKSNCQTCQTTAASNYLFGAASFCGKWDFSSHASWTISNGLVANQFVCHKFKYFFQGSLYGYVDTMIYCVYCPGSDGVGGTFANDAAAKTFHVTGFTMPNKNGLKWPTDTVGVVSANVVQGWTLNQALSTQFTPNDIAVLTSTIPLKQTKQSIIFQFTIVITNPLPYGSAIHLLAVSGEQLLSVLGKNQNPPCVVSRIGVGTFKCTFVFVAGGIQINIFDTVPAGRLDVSLYGLTVGSVSTLPTCQFKVTTYLDQLRTVALKVDETSASTFITINWDSPETSGSLTLSALNGNIWQKLATGDVYFTVTLADRNFLSTDFLSISLGAGAIMSDTSLARCYIRDLNMSITLQNIAVCNIEDLSNIIVQFNGDTTTKSFIVMLVGITIPEFATPGITATYKYNGDYTAFTSNTLSWASLVSFPQFVVTPVGYFQLDARGQRADLLITITPNSNVAVYRVIYVKLDTTFLGNISMYSYNVFQESDGMMLRSWIAGPGLLAVTGWLYSIEGNLPYTFRIVGIEVPAVTSSRALEVLVADETGLSVIDQWGQFSISAAPSMQGVSLIFIDALRYDSNIIRINSAVEMDLIFTETAPRYIYMRVFFDYLSQEIYKTFNPTCTLVLKGTKTNLITPCKAFGTKIEFYLGADMIAGNIYTLRINDIVNPDNGFCEPIPPRIIVSNAMKTKTVMISSNVVQNFLQIPFTNQKGIKILNFVSIPKGYLEVWRGFYDKVDIGPIVTSSTERPYYYDKVTYTLSYDLDGLFASDVIYFLGINSFTSSIGSSRASFIIGSNTNTVLTDYILYILRSEQYSQQYTSLPLLKVKILPNKASLITPNQVIVYKGASSLPIYVYPEKIPTVDTTFTISFVETFTEGLTFKDDLKEITLGVNTPLVSITINAESNTTVTSATLKLSRKLPASPFIDKTIPILIQPILTTGAPNVLISTRDIAQFDATVDFGSDQVLSILFYMSPSYSFKNFTKGTLEAWIQAGITYVGDTKIGYAIINNAADLITYTYTDLLADTTYILRTLYFTPANTTNIMSKSANFTTLPRTAVNGQLTFKFNEPLFMARRMWLLCQIAIKYAIPEEDLWTSDGLACTSAMTPSFITKSHTDKESAINATIAAQNDTSQVNSSILDPLKTINVLVFASRRRYQPPDSYELLFKETRTDSSLQDFQSFIGTTGTINSLGNSIKHFLTSTPTIQGEARVTNTGTNVTVDGITLSTEGSLLVVYARAELFTSTPSITDLKDVSTYSGFKYQSFAANASIQLQLSEGITANVNYTGYLVAFNNDPRINAKTSPLVSFQFTVSTTNTTKLSTLLQVAAGLAVALRLLLD
jgi:hypothetical protein